MYLCLCPGPVCGKLDASQKNVTIKSSEVIIIFRSGPHRSGRGFLLSYATDQYPGMIFVTSWLLFVKYPHGYDKNVNVVVRGHAAVDLLLLLF